MKVKQKAIDSIIAHYDSDPTQSWNFNVVGGVDQDSLLVACGVAKRFLEELPDSLLGEYRQELEEHSDEKQQAKDPQFLHDRLQKLHPVHLKSLQRMLDHYKLFTEKLSGADQVLVDQNFLGAVNKIKNTIKWMREEKLSAYDDNEEF
mmetsp:Transcript_23379/g.46088  ORF Transcript_23379/g.46088 Transcript_23379/m.46088 type:complete len:148 (-) Transcript_23379:175-618(-)